MEDCKGISDQITFGSNLGLWVSALKLGDISSFLFRDNSSKLTWLVTLMYITKGKNKLYHIILPLQKMIRMMTDFFNLKRFNLYHFYDLFQGKLQKNCLSFSLHRQTPNIIYVHAWILPIRCFYYFLIGEISISKRFLISLSSLDF